ncbi:MAG: hydantoinase/oxoprolinase family protein [Candidatus Helarchaeota archaeon]
MNILGLDIGGANIKASLIDQGKLKNKYMQYYPIWTKDLSLLPDIIKEVSTKVIQGQDIEAIAVTMTAELSDAFYTKREGILKISKSLREAFYDMEDKIYFINIFGEFIKFNTVLKYPLQVAAANWVATSKYVGLFYKNCILIDVGSTTTDVIPILNGKPVCLGKTDPDRLLSGELVYTGVLRSEIPSITHYVPYKNKNCRVSSEKFALSADVHLVLGHISEDEYTSDPADGREKNKKDSLARISRVICADIEMLSKKEIMTIARYIYEQQIAQIQVGLMQVFNRLRSSYVVDFKNFLIIITGIGAEFLARKAAKRYGFKKIINLNEILGENGGIVAPSAAVALLLEQKLIKR